MSQGARQRLFRLGLSALALLALAAGWLLFRLGDHPSLDAHARFALATPGGEAAGPQVRVTW